MKNIAELKNLANKTVLVRLDLDLPLDNKGRVIDDTRAIAAKKTIKYLLSKKAKIIVLGHLGRPNGPKGAPYRVRRVAGLSMKKIAPTLQRVWGVPVKMSPIVGHQRSGEIILLENTRFEKGGESGDDKLAYRWSRLADIFVLEAFATAHRNHASITGLPKFLPSYAGLQLASEVDNLQAVFDRPVSTTVTIVGGKKISSKIAAIDNLAKHSQYVLVGGAIATHFFKALKKPVGKSYYESDQVKQAASLLKKYKNKIVLPLDFGVSDDVNSDWRVDKPAEEISKNDMQLDIGPQTVKLYSQILQSAKTVVWAGPLGYYDNNFFNQGTTTIAKALQKNKGLKIIGGGDTLAALEKAKLKSAASFISTSGGAMLQYLAGQKLAGLQALDDNEKLYARRFWNLRQLTQPAAKHGFGVPAINIRSKLILQGVLQAAYENKSPIILEIAESEKDYCGISYQKLADWSGVEVQKLNKKYGYTVPIGLHADHIKHDVNNAYRAAAAGFSSVLVDQSHENFANNIILTKKVVEKLKEKNIDVEGELGVIGVTSSQKQLSKKEVLRLAPTAQQSVQFVSQTGIRAFAGFFGNVHGHYKFTPVVPWARMLTIKKALEKNNLPAILVMHGGSDLATKNLSHQQVFKKAIICGCHKFNYATDISDILWRDLPTDLKKDMIKAAGNKEDWRKALGQFQTKIEKLPSKIQQKIINDIAKHLTVMMKNAWLSGGTSWLYDV